MIPEECLVNLIDTDIQKDITESKKYNARSNTMLEALIDEKPELVDSRYSLYKTDHGPLLLFKNRVIIPNDITLKQRIIQRYHDYSTAGHPGEQET
jgi:hypothetical protein